MQSDHFIQQRIQETQEIMRQVAQLSDKDLYALTWKANPASWSVLECLEHLNLYGDFYIPAIKNAMESSINKSNQTFNGGFLGNYFAKKMLPKEKLNRLKTFKDKNPLNAPLDKTTIDRFLQQQTTLIELLETSKTYSLDKVKVSTSISKFIKLTLGDTFHFVINHNLRHMKQIERILNLEG